MNKPILTALLVLLIAALPRLAFADCSDPPAQTGTFIYNADENVPQVCAGSTWIALGLLNPSAGGAGCSNPTGIEGQVVYNADIHIPQYCDGDDWREMIGLIGGCAAPTSCPNVGDVCSDGSLFAGFMVYNNSSCEALYVTDNNQSTASQWKNATGTDDISADDPVDGQVNAANRGGVISDFPAFELCESNTYHGKSDWYLPARNELGLLWQNSGLIGGFNADQYWSSTEQDTTLSTYVALTDGKISGVTKTAATYDVRCVRRELASIGNSGGAGCTGPSGCTSIGDQCADNTIFAGCHPTQSWPLFIHPNDQSATAAWRSSGSGSETGAVDAEDGRVNQDWIVANRIIANFPAFKGCDDLNQASALGYTDWYLPSRVEMFYIWSVQAAINAGPGDDLVVTDYWSSNEYTTTNTDAYFQRFTNGVLSVVPKSTLKGVRCVRRE